MTISPEKQRTSRVFAIIPAAGRSRRMGRAKQLLHVHGRPMIETVVAPLCAAEVEGVALVTYSELAERLEIDRFKNTFVALNDDEQCEMIDSIRIGLAAWSERAVIGDDDGFLICPADQPGLETRVFNDCIRVFCRMPDRIILATHDGRRGHPIVFPASLVPFVKSSACDGGLNALPKAFADRIEAVACRSEAVVRDVDTPDDYEQLL